MPTASVTVGVTPPSVHAAPPAALATASPPAFQGSPDQPARVPPARLFLDLFAGAASPVTQSMSALGRMCFQPVDLLSGEHVDLLHDDTFASLRRLCASGLVGAAAAAPPCSAFSRARLRPGGPPAIRTVSHPRGKDVLSPAQMSELATSSLLHVRCRELLALVAARGGSNLA